MKRVVGLCVAGAMLAGCATPYKPIPYDRGTAAVTSIRVVEDAMAPEAGTQKLATNGQNMASAMAAQAGLAGVLVGAMIAGVEASIEQQQRNRMRAVLKAQGFDGEAVFDKILEAALTESGYKLSTIEVARAEPRDLVTATLTADPAAEAGTAVLDAAVLNYGYQRVGGTNTWRPFVTIKVHVTDAADPKKVLLDNAVYYNGVATPEVVINLPADEAYGFESIEAMEADPAKVAEGLTKAIEASAAAVAQMLK